MQNKIIILDFGSQYTQLIARRVRELNVYCEILPYYRIPEPDDTTKGIILSGSPYSVTDEKAPAPDLTKVLGKVPLLGVCYGAQYIAKHSGGIVDSSETREYGRANLETLDNTNPLFKNIDKGCQVWMSHGDTITSLPKGFDVVASTKDVKIAAYHLPIRNVFGIQFHPEVYHTTQGTQMLHNFLFDICGCVPDWSPASFVAATVEELRNTLGNDKVVLGLSGGVDSSVAALLLHKAIGPNLCCIFVNNGLLRKNEFDSVLDSYKHLGLNVKGVDASERFLKELDGVSEPEAKRKIIGRVFIEVFDEEAHLIKDVKWLAQGTIYPDVIESVSVNGPSVTIKSHHNVGGLPEKMNLKVIEPLKLLFKDEVRRVGKELGLPENILGRHPFPGPGLAIRILGEITAERVALLQEVDDIFINALKANNLYDSVWQAGVMLLPVKSVGVMGDERTYESVVALRAVQSTDGMTADWVHLPYEFLARVSNEIINKVRGVNRVVYDISSKPPATIEWE
ncbi:glutamine-hydrolyzing GMP synthase [Xiashengella succiniciproducens]|uniref:GMP synthase [glutamine-hydrolyzing] n=1 Tax=Xiashengella succiniciproducens TaxID=2949635 RepID=A0A9J6ZLE4_9BACT|nr:glutamine-hydrolyzing GMP synthase [Alkaliflexus sp. Ai-910]URW78545.1 glutamine-hydrolyzing GMP synthase [Alkaliflexus sp. Ai-910]